jgi:hypothetical protein
MASVGEVTQQAVLVRQKILFLKRAIGRFDKDKKVYKALMGVAAGIGVGALLMGMFSGSSTADVLKACGVVISCLTYVPIQSFHVARDKEHASLFLKHAYERNSKKPDPVELKRLDTDFRSLFF